MFGTSSAPRPCWPQHATCPGPTQEPPQALQSLRDVLELQVLPALAEMARHRQQAAGSDAAAGAAAALQQGQPAAAALQQYPLGFSTGDNASDLAATILRMLYIKDLRALQTLIDRTIVQVQASCAACAGL